MGSTRPSACQQGRTCSGVASNEIRPDAAPTSVRGNSSTILILRKLGTQRRIPISIQHAKFPFQRRLYLGFPISRVIAKNECEKASKRYA